jgi:hypothetical protein
VHTKHSRQADAVKSNQSNSIEQAEWVIRLDPGFLASRLNKMSHRSRYLILILDGFARMNPFVWCGNDTLAEESGMLVRQVQETLDDLEDKGWISRIYVGSNKRNRLAIIMRRRVGPGTPFADTSERLEETVRAARAGWRPDQAAHDPLHWMNRLGFLECGNPRTTEQDRMRKSSLVECGKTHSVECGNPHQNKDASGIRTKSKRTTKTGSSSSSEASLSPEGKEPPERTPEAEAGRIERTNAETALASAFTGIDPKKIESMIAKFGADVVIAAAGAYKPKGRPNEQGYFLGICKNIQAEGPPLPAPTARKRPEIKYFEGDDPPTFPAYVPTPEEDAYWAEVNGDGKPKKRPETSYHVAPARRKRSEDHRPETVYFVADDDDDHRAENIAIMRRKATLQLAKRTAEKEQRAAQVRAANEAYEARHRPSEGNDDYPGNHDNVMVDPINPPKDHP